MRTKLWMPLKNTCAAWSRIAVRFTVIRLIGTTGRATAKRRSGVFCYTHGRLEESYEKKGSVYI